MRRRRGHLALTTRIDSLRCRPLVGQRLLSGKKRRSPKGSSAFFISRRIAGGGDERPWSRNSFRTSMPCGAGRPVPSEAAPCTCRICEGLPSRAAIKHPRRRKTRRGGDVRDTLDACSAPLARLPCRTQGAWVNFGQRLSRDVAATATSFANASERLQIVIARSVREGRISRCRRSLLEGACRAVDLPCLA